MARFLPIRTKLLGATALSAALFLSANASAGGPPDLVRLKGGGLVRGTIVEMDPEGTVQLQRVTGKIKTIPMSRVEYVGAADKDPESANASPLSEAPERKPEPPKDSQDSDTVKLEFEAKGGDGEDVALLQHASSAIAVGSGGSAVAFGYREMCVAPCSISYRRGHHSFWLRRGDGVPIKAGSLDIQSDSKVQGRYISQGGARWGMLGIGAVAFLGGMALMFSSLGNTTSDASTTASTSPGSYEPPDTSIPTTFWVGLGLMAISPIALLAPVIFPDKARVKLVPLGDLDVAFRRREGQFAFRGPAGAGQLPQGAAMQFTF